MTPNGRRGNDMSMMTSQQIRRLIYALEDLERDTQNKELDYMIRDLINKVEEVQIIREEDETKEARRARKNAKAFGFI